MYCEDCPKEHACPPEVNCPYHPDPRELPFAEAPQEPVTPEKANASTPGPWEYFTQKAWRSDWMYGCVRAPNGTIILNGCSPGCTDEANANARLIAASPIMYDYIAKRAKAGCQEAVEILSSVNACQAAITAIAKATKGAP